MSISIATGGMFQGCCVSRVGGGGGAPPYRQNEEQTSVPYVLVKSVDLKSKKILESIQVKLLVDGGNEQC